MRDPGHPGSWAELQNHEGQGTQGKQGRFQDARLQHANFSKANMWQEVER